MEKFFELKDRFEFEECDGVYVREDEEIIVEILPIQEDTYYVRVETCCRGYMKVRREVCTMEQVEELLKEEFYYEEDEYEEF